MKKEVMEKWVAALRSGKYKQGRDKLKKKDTKGVIRHCCLGVLCELYNEQNKNNKYAFSDKDDQQLLPLEVEQWAGMKSNDGEINNSVDLLYYVEQAGLGELNYHHRINHRLSEFNDQHKFKFSALANIIEKFYEHI